jgi:hypothetical protein
MLWISHGNEICDSHDLSVSGPWHGACVIYPEKTPGFTPHNQHPIRPLQGTGKKQSMKIDKALCLINILY